MAHVIISQHNKMIISMNNSLPYIMKSSGRQRTHRCHGRQLVVTTIPPDPGFLLNSSIQNTGPLEF